MKRILVLTLAAAGCLIAVWQRLPAAAGWRTADRAASAASWQIAARDPSPPGPLAPGTTKRAKLPARERYPYQSPPFTRFVSDSYRELKSATPPSFYPWMEEAYRRSRPRLPGKGYAGWTALLQANKQELGRISDPAQRAKKEMELGAWLHKAVKTLIPRFSLDRGFEFTNVVRRGERQCFLQAVLIAGLLQAMDIDAGVVMVYRNHHRRESNNGHAVTLVKLADGTDIIVDASEPEPFARQLGLFAAQNGYRYVEPVYDGNSPIIVQYQAASKRERISTRDLRTLDVAFLRSQFDFYRGERAEGGFVSQRRTPQGMEASARYLRASVRTCPQNPLSVYLLGRVYLKQGKTGLARKQIGAAYQLYARAGWVPQGAREAHEIVARTPTVE